MVLKHVSYLKTKLIGGLSRICTIRASLFVCIVGFLVTGCTYIPNIQSKLLLGEEHYRHGRYSEAEKTWRTGLEELEHTSHDKNTVANYHAGLAKVYEGIGYFDRAAQHATQCLEGDNDRANISQAACIIILGSTYRRQGRYGLSERYLEDAAKTIDDSNNHHLKSDLYRNLGALAQSRKQSDQANNHYNNALYEADIAQDNFRRAQVLNNLGGVYKSKAQYDLAEEHYTQSLDIRSMLKDRAGLASTYGNLCTLQYRLGEITKALKLCHRSYKLARKVGALQREANSLNNLAAIYRRQNKFDPALRSYERSSTIKQQINDLPGLARTLNNIGEIYLSRNELSTALRFLERSIQVLQEINDRSGQVASLVNIGLIHEKQKFYRGALKAYSKVLMIQSTRDESEKLWRIYGNLSRIQQQLGNQNAAVFYGKQAVNTIQSIRRSVKKTSGASEKSFLKDKLSVYENLASLLIDEGRYSEAERVLMMLKQEEFFNYISRSLSEKPDSLLLDNTETEFVDGYLEISDTLAIIGREIERLLDTLQSRDLTDEENQLLANLENDRTIAEQQFTRILQQIDDHLYKTESDLSIDLKETERLAVMMSELERRSVLVTYLALDDKLRILIISPEIRIHYDVDITNKKLEQLAFTFHRAIKSKNEHTLKYAQELYGYLFEPIEKDLKDLEAEVVMVNLYRGLRYIPIAALHDGEKFVAEKFALSNYTNKSLDRLRESRSPFWSVAGFGVSKAFPGFDELPAVEMELDNIVQVTSQSDDRVGVMPGDVYMDERFTDQQLRLSLNRKYPVVHIATHFDLKPGKIEDSRLLLGTGDPLMLSDLQDPSYRLGQVDLLTLSACETGVNDVLNDGSEIEGFAELAQRKGTKSILATLWKVSDRSTAVFMSELYKRLADRTLTKAQALKQTQETFICPETNANKNKCADGSNKFANPFYWAPFVLIGNWI